MGSCMGKGGNKLRGFVYTKLNQKEWHQNKQPEILVTNVFYHTAKIKSVIDSEIKLICKVKVFCYLKNCTPTYQPGVFCTNLKSF